MQHRRRAAFGLLVLAGCDVGVPATGGDDGGGGDNGASTVDASPDDCAAIGDPFAIAELQRGVEFLASDQLAGRESDTPGDQATRAFVANAFRCAGLIAGGA